MTKYEINKFPPSLFKHGRFLREDWTACTDIGRTTPRGTLDKQEYLRVEGLYVAAVAAAYSFTTATPRFPRSMRGPTDNRLGREPALGGRGFIAIHL